MGLTNNDIIKKLRVALKLRDTDIVDILKLVDYDISTTELSAFFRAEDHEKYVELKDQILRNFLNGLVIHKRGKMERKPKSDEAARAKAKKLPPEEFRKPMGFKPKAKFASKTTIGGLKVRKRSSD